MRPPLVREHRMVSHGDMNGTVHTAAHGRFQGVAGCSPYLLLEGAMGDTGEVTGAGSRGSF